MPPPDWYLDELAHAGPEHLDDALVAAYDRKAQTEPAAEVALLRRLGLDERGVLVDLGAGTGTFALAAAPHCARVIAVDPSAAMRAAIAAKAVARGLDNVAIVSAGLLSYEHQGSPADCVYSRHVLHHLPDFWKGVALARIAALLRPGGIFYLRDLIFDFAPAEADAKIESWLAHAAARPEDGWTRAELATHLREEYSTYSWLMEALIERAGFTIRERDLTASGIYATYACEKR